MNVDVLRAADRWLGLPLCWGLTLVRMLLRPFHRPLPDTRPTRVLVVKLSEMGSTVLAYPAFAELKRRSPDAELYFLTFEENAAIFECLPLALPDHTLRVDTDGVVRTLRSGLAALRRLRRLKIDTVIDMDFFSRFSAAIAFLASPHGRRVGFHRFTSEGQGRGALLTHPVMYSPHIHTAEAFMSLTQALFSPWPGEVLLKEDLSSYDYRPPVHSPAPDTIEAVTKKLRDARLADADGSTVLILINPNSSAIFPLRKWPALQFTALCRRLLDARPEMKIAITGGRSERQEAETLAQQVGNPRCVNFAGQTTFPELLALYTLARVMVTNDSGPAHFASLANLPTVVLFGPETPRLYRPLGDHVRSIYTGFACSPCVSVYNAKRSPCRNNRCLQAIAVEQVYTETIALLDAPAG